MMLFMGSVVLHEVLELPEVKLPVVVAVVASKHSVNLCVYTVKALGLRP